MKGKHASQTLKRLAKDLAGHPVLLFLAFLGNGPILSSIID